MFRDSLGCNIMFENVNFEEIRKRYQNDAEQLLPILPERYELTARELLPIIWFTNIFAGSTAPFFMMRKQEFPTTKIALGYLGGLFSAFCQDHDVPATRHTDFLHVFFLTVYGNSEGDNLVNNFLYLYKQEDEEAFSGIVKGMQAYKDFLENGSQAFLTFTILEG